MGGRIVFGMGALLFAATVCWADSIKVDGKAFENVLIRESASMYYVQIPSEGSVFSVPKSEIREEEVSISGDAAQRDALREEWTRKHNQARNIVTADASTEPRVASATAAGGQARTESARTRVVSASRSDNASGGAEADDYISRIKLKDVPLGTALKAILRTKNLDYEVEDGYIWISTPEKLRRESFETPETRMYGLRSPGADTLPKIVVRNPGAAQVGYGGQGYGSGQGYSSGQGYGQGYGYNQGVGSAGYGGTGGYRGAGGMPFQQTAGGMGYGGMYGGQGMAGMPMPMTGPHFSNIAELFSTIDDRLVGETPAIIGISGLR